ncbi:MAG: hypothetical protein RA163_00495 [Arsenophonus sp.]|nr:MAG: hypothetical protein RA163_00495 [Arsenophonus sp.]
MIKKFNIEKKIFFVILISVLLELLSGCGIKDVLYLSSEVITSNKNQEDEFLSKDVSRIDKKYHH